MTVRGTAGGGEVNNRGIQLNPDTSVTTGDGNITLTGNGGGGFDDGVITDASDAGSDSNHGILVFSATVESTGAGAIVINATGGGSMVNDARENHGLQLTGTGSVESNTGNITIDATGGPGEGFNTGVALRTGTSISTVDGASQVDGEGGGGFNDGSAGDATDAEGDNNYGVYLENAAAITASGDGSITIDGTGNGAAIDGISDNDGFQITSA